jgi:serine/threonine protein phosphatase PrpC
MQNPSTSPHTEQRKGFLSRILHLKHKNVEKSLSLNVAQRTDVGLKRDHNEDNVAYIIPKDETILANKGALCIVADGMGGHAAGEVASEIAVATICNMYYQNPELDVSTSLIYAIKQANANIYQHATEDASHNGMGTTSVVAVLRGNTAYIANVGDSRCYMFRQGMVRQITQDHSWVAEQVRLGHMSEEQARTHGMRNVITRSLGPFPDVEVDVFVEQVEEGDIFLLCSDGLCGMISDMDMLRNIQQFEPQECVFRLVECANANGGMDNITAIVAHVVKKEQ